MLTTIVDESHTIFPTFHKQLQNENGSGITTL